MYMNFRLHVVAYSLFKSCPFFTVLKITAAGARISWGRTLYHYIVALNTLLYIQ